MTNEEAIKHITTWLYAAPDMPPKQVVQAQELAVAALRAGGKDKDVPTMPAGHPLTLEQLRGMDGRCVKVVVYGVEPLEMLALVEAPEDEGCVLLRNNLGGVSEFYSDEDLMEDGVKVYAYSHANINREAWTGCTCNTKSKSCCTCVSLRCQFCIGESEYKRGKYCSACGRPMTEEAWAELEKRVRGNEMKAYFEGEKGVLVFKSLPGGKCGRPQKRTNEERLKQMGTQELARELALIAMWDRKQLKKAQENPGLEAFMGKWLREPAEDN